MSKFVPREKILNPDYKKSYNEYDDEEDDEEKKFAPPKVQ